MPLPLHLAFHVLLSVFAGVLAGRITKEWKYALLAALVGGVLVDLDHLLDYFLQFGFTFNLQQFLGGAQFSMSGKLYIFFHAWEYVPVFLVAYFFVKHVEAKAVLLGLALGLFLHLCADVVIDGMPFTAYSILCRMNEAFSLGDVTNSGCGSVPNFE